MDLLALAGLPIIRDLRAPQDGGSADLRAQLRAVYDGIAGEDDLDAPSDAASEAEDNPKPAVASSTGYPDPTPVLVRPAQLEPKNETNPPVRKKLTVEQSAAIRAQLVQEIGTLPDEGLQQHAIAILKAKNRLSAGDAKQVEDAFAARMVKHEPTVEALTADQPPPVPARPILPSQLLATGGFGKRPRGRPRKIQPPIEKATVVPHPQLSIPPFSTRPLLAKP